MCPRPTEQGAEVRLRPWRIELRWDVAVIAREAAAKIAIPTALHPGSVGGILDSY
jgi:hypothetical protein